MKKRHKLVERLKAGVLSLVLNGHQIARGEMYHFSNLIPRPAFRFPRSFDGLSKTSEVIQAFFLDAHNYITLHHFTSPLLQQERVVIAYYVPLYISVCTWEALYLFLTWAIIL